MKNCTLFVATCFFTLLPLHIMAAGPQLTAARFGVATGDLKNAVTSSAGDVNNDNYDDILIGAPF
ncbi:MAG: FG-GAP repeat protein, partial [Pseudomonadales bacterium]|nr:FG-GAP repeat protein [Pseudomonadales bacterium]